MLEPTAPITATESSSNQRRVADVALHSGHCLNGSLIKCTATIEKVLVRSARVPTCAALRSAGMPAVNSHWLAAPLSPVYMQDEDVVGLLQALPPGVVSDLRR